MPALRDLRVANERAILAIGLLVRRLPKERGLDEDLLEDRQLAGSLTEATIVIQQVPEQAHAVPVVSDGGQHVEMPEQIDVAAWSGY